MKRQGTVCFIVDGDKVLLALIEYSPTDQKWSGIGGFVEKGESMEDAVMREIQEETYLSVNKEDLKKVAEIEYPSFQLNVFVAYKWSGELKIKDATLKELRWFSIGNLPFTDMHENNDKWVPLILSGKSIKFANGVAIEVANFND